MSSGRVFRFAPTPEHRTNHLFVFLHGCGATAQSMVPIALQFQARFPSAALVVPSGFDPDARGGAAQEWYPTRGLTMDNHRERVAAVLPDVDDLVRREQTQFGVPASRTVLIGFSQGGTVALEAVKAPGLAGAVVAFAARYARLPGNGARINLAHPSGARRIRLHRFARATRARGARAVGAARAGHARHRRGPRPRAHAPRHLPRLAAPAAGHLRRPARNAALI